MCKGEVVSRGSQVQGTHGERSIKKTLVGKGKKKAETEQLTHGHFEKTMKHEQKTKYRLHQATSDISKGCGRSLRAKKARIPREGVKKTEKM